MKRRRSFSSWFCVLFLACSYDRVAASSMQDIHDTQFSRRFCQQGNRTSVVPQDPTAIRNCILGLILCWDYLEVLNDFILELMQSPVGQQSMHVCRGDSIYMCGLWSTGTTGSTQHACEDEQPAWLLTWYIQTYLGQVRALRIPKVTWAWITEQQQKLVAVTALEERRGTSRVQWWDLWGEASFPICLWSLSLWHPHKHELSILSTRVGTACVQPGDISVKCYKMKVQYCDL